MFVDTPGYHISDKKFNIHMTDLVGSALEETDLILYVVDATREPGEEEQYLVELVKRFQEKTIAAVNKVDVENNQRDIVKAYLRWELPEVPIHEISALKEEGTAELEAALFDAAPEGDQLYPPEYYTDQDPEFRASEIIREKALSKVTQEVPHAIYVEIADMEIRKEEERLWIRAFIMVERESQKGILVGKKGNVIKSIRQEAQKELAALFPYRIYLDLRVKVNPKWRRKDGLLRKLIH